MSRMGHWADVLIWKIKGSRKRDSRFKWINTSGGTVRVLDVGDPSLPAVVMVPDGPCVVEHFEGLIQELQGRKRVVCFDLPGFGFSFPAKGYDHSFGRASECILEVMDALKIEKATLNFTCVNGFYALAVAKRAPERVEKLVLGQTPSMAAMEGWTSRIIPKPILFPVVGQILAYQRRAKVAGGWFKFSLPAGTDGTSWARIASAAIEQGGCNCLGGVVQGVMAESADSLKGVTVPVTMVWGSADRTHASTQPESLLELVPHAQVIEYKDCGHFPNLEKPKAFTELLF